MSEPLYPTLTRSDDATIIAALAHYSMHVADPSLCDVVLLKLGITSDSWYEKRDEMRSQMRELQSPRKETRPASTQTAWLRHDEIDV